MSEHLHDHKKDGSKAVAHTLKKSENQSSVSLADNRPGAVSQRALLETIQQGGPARQLNAPPEMTSRLQDITTAQFVRDLYVNADMDGSVYPHLHVDNQFIGYSLSGGNQVELRTNGDQIRNGWKQRVGEAVPGNWNAARKRHHLAIINWLKDNEPDVWAGRN